MIRAYYKDNPQQYKDFEDFLFLFPEKHRIEFDFTSDTIWIDGIAFQLSKIQFISDNTAELDARYEQISHKNEPNGYAGLDENAKIPSNLLYPHTHNKITGEQYEIITLDPGGTVTNFRINSYIETLFTANENITFNAIDFKVTYYSGDVKVIITIDNQEAYNNTVKVVDIRYKRFLLEEIINVSTGQKVKIKLEFNTDFISVYPVINSNYTIRYDGRTQRGLAGFRRLILLTNEKLEWKNGLWVKTATYSANIIPLLWKIQNIYVESDTEPQNPFAGQLWYNPTTQELKIYTSAGWALIPLLTGSQLTQRVVRI